MDSDDDQADQGWHSSKIKGFKFNEDATTVLGVSTKGASDLSHKIESVKSFRNEDDRISADFSMSQTAPKCHFTQLFHPDALKAVLGLDDCDRVNLKNVSKEQRTRLNPSINTCLKLLLFGLDYSFEHFRSYESKRDLLNSAVSLGDGDAILEVVIFLSKTLNARLFRELLATSPVAVKHYSNYLETRMKLTELAELLILLGYTKELYAIQFKMLCSNPLRRISNLSSKTFENITNYNYVKQFISLIKWQGNSQQDVGSSVRACLSRLCESRWGDPEDPMGALVSDQQVTSKLQQWVAVEARAGRRDWKTVTSMLLTRNWLNTKRLNSQLPLYEIILELHRLSAPVDLLESLLGLMDDMDERMKLSSKLNLSSIIVDQDLTGKGT